MELATIVIVGGLLGLVLGLSACVLLYVHCLWKQYGAMQRFLLEAVCAMSPWLSPKFFYLKLYLLLFGPKYKA